MPRLPSKVHKPRKKVKEDLETYSDRPFCLFGRCLNSQTHSSTISYHVAMVGSLIDLWQNCKHFGYNNTKHQFILDKISRGWRKNDIESPEGSLHSGVQVGAYLSWRNSFKRPTTLLWKKITYNFFLESSFRSKQGLNLLGLHLLKYYFIGTPPSQIKRLPLSGPPTGVGSAVTSASVARNCHAIVLDRRHGAREAHDFGK